MFAKYFEIRIAWLFAFILSLISTFASVWLSYFTSEWEVLALGLFFLIVCLFLLAGIHERKVK
jgi:hypothetical protein